MTRMDVEGLIAQLEQDGPRLAGAAAAAGWDAAVPGTAWDVRTLVTHVGGVHRWAADVVATCAAGGDTDLHRAVGSGPPDAELLDWFAEGHAALVATLRAAPADLACYAFLPAESPLHFWARRQAHETAIHRADAEAAAGAPVTPFAAAFAQDGIGELLTGFARRRSNAASTPAVIGLDAADGPSWSIRFGGERTDTGPADDLTGTDVTVRGLSSDLYLWLWNRPSQAVADGDGRAAALWHDTVQVRWG